MATAINYWPLTVAALTVVRFTHMSTDIVAHVCFHFYFFRCTSLCDRAVGLVRGWYPGITAAYLRQWTYGSCRVRSSICHELNHVHRKKWESLKMPRTESCTLIAVVGIFCLECICSWESTASFWTRSVLREASVVRL